MLFSIIIPCYNASKTLPRTMDSLLVQKEWIANIILIDDGSKDNTLEIANDYQELYPHLIDCHHQDNKGPAAARNLGVEYIRGEYTIFLDADDTLSPDTLKVYHHELIDNPEIDMLIAGYQSIHPDKKSVKLPKPYKDSIHMLKAFWFGNLSVCAGATAIRSSVLNTIQSPPNIKHGEDIVFLSHLLAKYSAKMLSFIALNVYHHSDSLRHQSHSTLSEGEKIIPILFDLNILSTGLMKYQARFHAKHLIALARVANQVEQQDQSREYLLKAIRIHPKCLFELRTLKTLMKCASLRPRIKSGAKQSSIF